jgi:glycosyltransferase involved in cell wall biosynthesis
VPKERLLFASPFPLSRTEIAEYAATLAEAMKPYFEVALLVEDRTKHRSEDFEVLGYRNDAIDWSRYAHRFYHIGNNPWYHSYIYECCLQHPGVVLLHETVLYYLYTGYYRAHPDFYTRVYQDEGARGLALVRRQIKDGADLLRFPEPQLLPFNRELIHSGNRFLTHSEYARNQVLARAERPVEVRKIEQVVPVLPECDAERRWAVRQRLRIPADAPLLASLGFVAPPKLNHIICRAVNRWNSSRASKIYYTMVGEGTYVNEMLNEYVRITGYASSLDYEDYLAACDLVLNLRYPSMGETSAAALRALRAGKPCILTNDGWFAELPDDIAVKLEPDAPEISEEVLYRVIELFLSNRESFEAMGRNAAAYTARHHDAAVVAADVAEYILQGSRHTGERDSTPADNVVADPP